MAKKTGLGKGLEALLGESAVAFASNLAEPKNLGLNNFNNSTNVDGVSGVRGVSSVGDVSDGGVIELEVHQLSPGKYQPRHHIVQPELEQLAESIRSQGVIQ